MVSGHTKFDPDKGFGNIKKYYNTHDCENIIVIQDIINNSSYNNMFQLIREPISNNL